MIQRVLLPKPVLDHSLVVLEGGGIINDPTPLRFESMWLKEEGFFDLLKGWWVGMEFSGSTSFILASKLKALKVLLKKWNQEVFGNVSVMKEEAFK